MATETFILSTKDLMVRYQCGLAMAQKHMREIKSVNGGGKFGRGRVSKDEVELWERILRATNEKVAFTYFGGFLK